MFKAPTLFTFFAGAGFLDLGFETSGYNVAFVNEYHKPFMDTYRHARKGMKDVFNLHEPEFGYHVQDVSDFIQEPENTILSHRIEECRKRGELIGFIGGPPCPDFSVGGKNRGFEGDNGKLTATYVELICQQQPDFFIFENVKGLWRTQKHRSFFDQMIQKLKENGYMTTAKLINAIEFGAPQVRERIILFGIRGKSASELGIELQKGQTLDDIFPWEKHIKYKAEDIAKMPFPTMDPFAEKSLLPMPEGLPEELTVEYWFRKNDVKNHPNTQQYFKPRAGLAKFEVIPEGDDSKKSYKRLHRWRYSPTAAYGNNEVHLHPYEARRISVAEALAIQSLPKEYTLPDDITLSNAFKTVGNGVPYLAAKGIAQTVLDFIWVGERVYEVNSR
ncbi:DNA cytosine methyltransferase [Paenibacillus aestuarii]|uniref:DNA (cytosine-5-)-methyltransferase n=1 Tax=Paenibacillus aestuarii TaxID=516965 RepID=A0ABW0KGK0_9BACL|nr:DNA cytosine methyltransferase [Paenibacillus aestuarii]